MLLRLLSLSLVLFAGITHGQTLYVSDHLVITVRTGAGTEYAVIENLVSGDAVEILDESEDGNYSLVRTQSGVEGWALTRYLADVPAAKDRLVLAGQSLAEAEVRIATLEETLEAHSAEVEVTQQRLAEAESANATLARDLADLRDAAENVLTIRDQNESLRRRLNERDQEVEILSIQNESLQSGSARDWFVVGAGVLFGGILIGLIVPRLKPRRRSDW